MCKYVIVQNVKTLKAGEGYDAAKDEHGSSGLSFGGVVTIAGVVAAIAVEAGLWYSGRVAPLAPGRPNCHKFKGAAMPLSQDSCP